MKNKEKKQMLTTELTKEKSGRSAGMIQDMSINGIKLHLAQNGTGGPVIFWGMYPHQQNEVEHLWESLLELVPEQNFLLVAFQVENWNRDFSPWEASAVFGKEGFADSLKQTLEEAGWANRNIAGAGTALSNLWEGGKQLFGQGNANTFCGHPPRSHHESNAQSRCPGAGNA